MTDWQSMETAPRDGTIVLGYNGTNYKRVVTMKFKNNKWLDGYNEINIYTPSHWMPLPVQDIKTAPMDTTRILAQTKYREDFNIIYYGKTLNCADGHEEYWRSDASDQRVSTPLFWTHIPAPPKPNR